MPKDYYETLGVSRTASADEIHKAYKKLAAKYHPDRNPGDKQAEATFREVQNAYDTLKDPEKRQGYDRYGPDGPPQFSGGGFPGGGDFSQVDPKLAEELFGRFFGGGGGMDLGDMFGGGRRSGPARPRAVEADARVPFATMVTGGVLHMDVGGRAVEVRVPAGIEDGKKLRVGGVGPGGGDILVKVHVEPHPYFRREGKDILLDVPIGVAEAVLGGPIEVPTPAGPRVGVKVPAGTSSGQRLRLRGQGAGGGDLYLVFKIKAVKADDARSRELIEEFARLHPQDPRADAPWR